MNGTLDVFHLGVRCLTAAGYICPAFLLSRSTAQADTHIAVYVASLPSYMGFKLRLDCVVQRLADDLLALASDRRPECSSERLWVASLAPYPQSDLAD